MILGFKPQFKQKILDGTKIHTVRFGSKRKFRSGNLLHMATGVRTKLYNCFAIHPCVSTQRVFMSINQLNQIEATIGNHELFGHHEREQFAKNDGFESWEEMEDWFFPILQKCEDQCDSGVLIHWTEFKY